MSKWDKGHKIKTSLSAAVDWTDLVCGRDLDMAPPSIDTTQNAPEQDGGAYIGIRRLFFCDDVAAIFD